VEGTDEMAARYAGIWPLPWGASSSITMKNTTGEISSRTSSLTNILPGDVYIKARELHFGADISRVVFLVRIVSASAFRL
jgi:carbohydrate diacid regulator